MPDHGQNSRSKMTIKEWIEMVMNTPSASPYAKHLAHVIFHRWDEETNTCRLSASEFARLTSLSLSTVQRYINELSDFVEKIEKGRGRAPNTFTNSDIVVTSDSYSYELVTSEGHNNENELVTSERHNKGGSDVSQTQQKGNLGGDYRGGEEGLSQDNPDLFKTIDPNPLCDFNKSHPDELFEIFWKEFPSGRKRGKGKCRTTFKKIIAGKKAGFKANAKTIIDAAITYRKSLNGDHRFVPLVSTWLNEGRWEDDTKDSPNPTTEERDWGWWKEIDGWEKLTIDQWRGMIKSHKPNGSWPWRRLGPPPGHPECLMPTEAQAGYGDKYADQVKQLETEFGGKND